MSQDKIRSHTFHVYQVSAASLKQGQTQEILIWDTLSNPANYVDGISTLAGQHDGTGYRVELREVAIDSNAGVIVGCIAKCREDAPPLRKSNGKQVLQALQVGDSFLEKNYFRYDRDTRLLVWQFHLGGNGFNSFGQMLSILSGSQQAFSCAPVVRPGFTLSQSSPIEFIDFKVVMPRTKKMLNQLLAQDPTNWGALNPFHTMKQYEATAFEAKVTSKRNTTLGERVIQLATSLSENFKQVRKLKLKLEDIDEPVDLLTTRFKARKDVSYHGHHLDSNSMLSALDEVWHDYQN